ncbi:IS4/Tn5 family transposase DNA-binding protein [Nostoc sp.]
MSHWWSKNFALSQLGDRRLNRRHKQLHLSLLPHKQE